MEKFRIIAPAAALAPYIKHYWILESDDVTTTQRIIPTGNIELVFHRGALLSCNNRAIPRTTIAGQSVVFADLVPTGRVNMIAVVFQPFGARAFFEMPVSELSGLTVSADDLNDRTLKELEEKILAAPTDESSIGLIEAFLTKRIYPYPTYNYGRLATAIRAVNRSGGSISVPQLAETACLSPKQLQRIFTGYVGATPKAFMRVVRFHKALFTLQNNPSISFTALAYECGYYDQAHLTNEFKLFSGYSPREYLGTCAPYSDYYSH